MSFLQKAEELLAEILVLVDEEKLIIAASKIEVLLKQIEELSEEQKTDPEISKFIAKVKESNVSVRIKEAEEVKYILELLNSTDWTQTHESDGIKVQAKYEAGSKLCAFKAETLISSPITGVAPIIAEVDLYHLWIPRYGNTGLRKSSNVAILGRCRRVAYLHVGLPWPIADREFVVFGMGCLMLEEGRCLILLKSINEMDGVELPATDSSIVRAEINHGCYLLEAVTETSTKLTMLAHVDLKMDYVPPLIINLATKNLLSYGFQVISKLSANPPIEYAARVESNPHLYDFVNKQAIEYFKKKNEENQEKINAVDDD